MNTFKNRKAVVTVFVFLIYLMWGCSDSTSINNHSGVGSQTNAAQNNNKLLRKKPLYTFVNKQKNIKQFSTKQNTHLSAIQNWSKNVNIRMAKLAANPSSMLQKGQMLELPISSQKSVLVKGTKITHPSSNAIGWYGAIQNNRGHVHLMFIGNQLTGTIKTGTDAYKIETFGPGLIAVIQLNGDKRFGPVNDVIANDEYSPQWWTL